MAKSKVPEHLLPVRSQPKVKSPVNGMLRVPEVAFIMAKVLGRPVSPPKIYGAIASLGLRNSDEKFPVIIRGPVVSGRYYGTLVHKSKLKPIESYLNDKSEAWWASRKERAA